MRIPESLFPAINMVARALLRSPLHGLASGSMMVIYYTGRKSGKALATPVRYKPMPDGRIRATTSEHVQWWRNLQANPDAQLRVAGDLGRYKAKVLEREPATLESALRDFLATYPQDAVYQDIRLEEDGSLNEEDLAAALKLVVIVDFDPV